MIAHGGLAEDRPGASSYVDPSATSSGGEDWHEAAKLPEMQDLLRTKRRTIGLLLAGSLGAFAIVLLLAGFARPLMATPVLGALNLGYLLIIGIYLMCWTVAAAYVAFADRVFDPAAAAVAARLGSARPGPARLGPARLGPGRP